jgi:solute carrier family 30 (zinc transporter), member 9
MNLRYTANQEIIKSSSGGEVGKISAMYAFCGNAMISVAKAIGYVLSGSPSLFGEMIHSIADTANQGFLLVGIHKSKKKADADFAYGYGSERFFWALLSACGIFFVGAGITAYHGITSLFHHNHIELKPIILIILAFSFIVESITLYRAYREIKHQMHINEADDFFEYLKDADPVLSAVLYEDAVAVLGVLTAFIGISLSYITGDHIYDSLASVIIALMLAYIAVILINKNRKFLLGKAIPENIKSDIIEILEEDEHIDKVLEFKSEILNIGHYHIKCEIEFNGASLLSEIMQHESLQKEWEEIDGEYEEFKKYIIYHTSRIPRIMGKRIDKIEAKIKAKYPQIAYIDLEIN